MDVLRDFYNTAEPQALDFYKPVKTIKSVESLEGVGGPSVDDLAGFFPAMMFSYPPLLLLFSTSASAFLFLESYVGSPYEDNSTGNFVNISFYIADNTSPVSQGQCELIYNEAAPPSTEYIPCYPPTYNFQFNGLYGNGSTFHPPLDNFTHPIFNIFHTIEIYPIHGGIVQENTTAIVAWSSVDVLISCALNQGTGICSANAKEGDSDGWYPALPGWIGDPPFDQLVQLKSKTLSMPGLPGWLLAQNLSVTASPSNMTALYNASLVSSEAWGGAPGTVPRCGPNSE